MRILNLNSKLNTLLFIVLYCILLNKILKYIYNRYESMDQCSEQIILLRNKCIINVIFRYTYNEILKNLIIYLNYTLSSQFPYKTRKNLKSIFCIQNPNSKVNNFDSNH